MKNITTEMKNTLEVIKRLKDAEEQISKLEDRVVEITDTKRKKRMKTNEDSLKDF